jgi:hypothetical protein
MAALIGAGSYAVHQLRFALYPGDSRVLHEHGYLAPLGAVLVAVLLLALAAGLERIARGSVVERPRLGRLWPGATVSLVAIYCVQESLEVVLAHGETRGIFTHGGWVALPLALAVGLGIALLMRGAAAASEVAVASARRAARIALVRDAVDAVLAPRPAHRSHAVARHEAARGPPLASA